MSKKTKKKLNHQNKAEQSFQFKDQDLPHQEHIDKPHHLKRLSGFILIFIGAIGSILTTPLILFGGFIGFLSGLIFGNNLFNSAFTGAKIGALGCIDLILYGLDLTKAAIERQKTAQKKSPLTESESLALDTGDHQKHISSHKETIPEQSKESTSTFSPLSASGSTTFFKKTEEKSEVDGSKIDESESFDKIFLATVNEYITQEEAQTAAPKEIENSRHINDADIETLITVTKDSTQPESKFWDILEQMTLKDIELFVSKLSAEKKNKFSSSELDYLWRHFHGFELEPSKRENKKVKFSLMLRGLSEEQIKASFNSPDFLNCFNKGFYAEAAADTLNSNQLKLFASKAERHTALNSIIEKMKPGSNLLGKLVSIMPHATETIKKALSDQITHLPHLPSFKSKLDKLARNYIDINSKTAQVRFKKTQTDLPRTKSLPSKWTPVPTRTKSKYNTVPIKKEELPDEVFETFLHELNDASYMIYEQKILDILSRLPDARIKTLLERASLPNFCTLLKHLWVMEAKTLNQKSLLDSRENRLRIILEYLSESQLKSSVADNKFWEIFRNTQGSYCKMAAETLSPQQFELIIANAPLERHEDLAVIISQINKDSPEEKERLKKIIEAILPHTTPWLVLEMEKQIKHIPDKLLQQHLSNELKSYLKESLEKQEVFVRYTKALTLNKKAISLLVESAPILQESSRLGLNK